MTVERIKYLEERLQEYKNNLRLAVQSGEKPRVKRYQNLIRDTELKIKELEKDVPLEANEHLRSVINELNEQIKSLKAENEELRKQLQEHEKKIELLVNPPKPEKKEESKDDLVQCPKCGRMIKRSGMKIHQARWCKGRA